MNMFNLKSLCVVFLSLAAMPTFATTITFDDLPGDQSAIPNGYNGLNWTNFNDLNGVTYFLNPSGYQAGVISPNNVAYNAFGAPAMFSNTLFNLNSAYLTAAWNDNLMLEVIGKLSGTTLYDHNYVLSATTPTLINFNYLGVDSVQFISSGGTNHSGYSGTGTQFAMDNLVINAPTGVPDGGTTALLLSLSICGLGFLRRKLS